MSTIDLVVLGILLKHPLNALEIVKYVNNRGVDRLVKISSPAIYKSCKRLFKAELLDGKKVQEGEMPEKVIYTVNQNGKDYFVKLMENYSSNIKPFYMDFNSFLWNLDHLEKEEALEMMEKLKTQIEEIKNWILQHEKEHSIKKPKDLTFAAKSIVKQYRMVFITLSQWIEEIIEEFKLKKTIV